MTRYRIRTKDAEPSYVKEMADDFYAWGGLKSALIFNGREEAKEAANKLEALIKARGYHCELAIVPATGGMAISR